MAMHPDYPGAASFTDSRGKTRWRFRVTRVKSISLRGAPGDAQFNSDYQCAIAGAPKRAAVKREGNQTVARSFGAAWLVYSKSSEFKNFNSATQSKHERMANAFLMARVNPDSIDTLAWRDVPVVDFKRRHVKLILSRNASTPHKAKHMLVTIRKLIVVALDEEWIETDPTWKVKHRPEYTGWRAWTDGERAKFEARHPIGGVPRAVYAAALWLGNRRSDIVTLSRNERQARRILIDSVYIEIDCFVKTIQKTGDEIAMPIAPMAADALDALPADGTYYFPGRYGECRSAKALTGDMAKWTKQAGLPAGCTLHGLRKTLGRMAAEGEATSRQSMDLLGHTTLQQAELYSRAANQLRMAKQAIDKVVTLHVANNAANTRG